MLISDVDGGGFIGDSRRADFIFSNSPRLSHRVLLLHISIHHSLLIHNVLCTDMCQLLSRQEHAQNDSLRKRLMGGDPWLRASSQ
jgi:hypothetical protein